MPFEYWLVAILIIMTRFILGVRKDFKEVAQQKARDAHDARCTRARTNGRNQ